MQASTTPETIDWAWFLLQDNRFDRAEQVHRAWFLLQSNQFDRAEQVLREYLSEYPDRVCAHTMLATCLFDLSRHSEAIESAKLAIALDPNSYYQYWILGCLYVRLQQLDLAEEYLLEAIDRDPNLPYCYALAIELAPDSNFGYRINIKKIIKKIEKIKRNSDLNDFLIS